MTRTVLSIGNFLSASHFFLIVYIIAPYLATFMPANQTGLVISMGAVLTLTVLPFAPRIIAHYGPRHLAVVLGCTEFVVLSWLSLSPPAPVAVLLSAVAFATSPLIAYQLDLLLEGTVSEEGATGRVRTAFLTAGNSALILAPLVTGLLLGEGDHYSRVFLAAACSLVPFVVLFNARKAPHIPSLPTDDGLRRAALRAWRDRDLRAVIGGAFILQSFYNLATLYIPLYLHDALGMPWSQLGWMFAIMLLPFVLVEYPAGIIADRVLGDQELMFSGFVLAGLSFGLIAFVHGASSVAFVLGLLVATRVGGALAESMTEGHFFRRVSEKDASMVGLFRAMRPTASLIAPLIGSLLLGFFGYQALFALSGLLVIAAGGIAALSIRDFR